MVAQGARRVTTGVSGLNSKRTLRAITAGATTPLTTFPIGRTQQSSEVLERRSHRRRCRGTIATTRLRPTRAIGATGAC
jgi:hypothetical protein